MHMIRKAKAIKTAQPFISRNNGFLDRARRDYHLNRDLYLLIIPVLAYYIIFHYIPIYGAQIAFKDYSPALGISGSEWVGFKHFQDFFASRYFIRVLKNTLVISFTYILLGFPVPILLAILLNELHSNKYKRVAQSLTYLPHFISLVVVCGMIRDFTMDTGIINQVLALFGHKPVTMLGQPDLFVPIYVISGIWQEAGWGSIIYLAAITGIDPQLYEAAKMDGAGRLRQIWSVVLPSILPTIIIMLIMRMGRVMNVGAEKILLLYNPGIYETSDVINTYVYRMGLMNFNYSYSSAVGLFNSLVNFTLLIIVNQISRMTQETSLW